MATQLNAILGHSIGFAQCLLVGLPIVILTLPIVWVVLTFVLFPPEVDDVSEAREQAAEHLEEEGAISPRGRRVAVIFTVTAVLWVVGGPGELVVEPSCPTRGTTPVRHRRRPHRLRRRRPPGPALLRDGGPLRHPGAGARRHDGVGRPRGHRLGTILLFGGGISLADAFAETGATEWVARAVFGSLTGAPIVLAVAAVVLLAIMLTEMTSNTATATIVVPILIGIGGIFAETLGLAEVSAAAFLSVSGAIAASFAFALPVATPPNAIVLVFLYIEQEYMMRAGTVPNVLMTVVLTGLIWFLLTYVWPMFRWCGSRARESPAPAVGDDPPRTRAT